MALREMNPKELQLARRIGTDVSLHKIKIPYPICLDDDPASAGDPQLLASIGDNEEVLFCPRCDFQILLHVSEGR
jgi:hypothetical protein